MTVANINQLLPENIYEVFGHLNRYELSACCSVNKNFHTIANTNALWSRFATIVPFAQRAGGGAIFLSVKTSLEVFGAHLTEFYQASKAAQFGFGLCVLTFAQEGFDVYMATHNKDGNLENPLERRYISFYNFPTDNLTIETHENGTTTVSDS